MKKVTAVGEVLWDLLPDGKQLGGAPGNFAYHCRALGLDARLVTRIGDDELGREILARFRAIGLPTDFVQVDPEAPTGTVGVELDDEGLPCYAIYEGVAWDRIAADESALAFAAQSDAVCFGTLSRRAPASREAAARIVAAAGPGALRILDVNLRSRFYDRDVVADSLGMADVLKLNDAELIVLTEMFDLALEPRDAVLDLVERFDLEVVAVTRGGFGGLLYRDGEWSDRPGVSVAVVDSIGAGDAFAAALTEGLLAGRPLDEINRRGNALAAFVCSRAGGTPAAPDALIRGL